MSLKGSNTDIIFIQLDLMIDTNYLFFNLGMLSISTLLKQKGFSVRCLKTSQLTELSYEAKEQYFKQLNPKIVGLNVNSDNCYGVKYMARDIKKWLPESIVLVGGPLITILGESILEELSIDMAIVGEGEFPTLKLCDYLIRNNGNLNTIEGLIYRENRIIKKNAPAELIRDLDILPDIDYSLTEIGAGVSYSSGRGCPFKCSFCFRGVSGEGYRFFSPQRVVDHIMNSCEKYNIKTIGIIDDTFLANTKRAIEICSKLKEEQAKRNIQIGMFCESRIDTLYKHPELLTLMKDAGIMRIQVGIENGNQCILDAYNKNITLKQVEQVIENVAKTGPFTCDSNFIIGGAFETEKTFNNTLNFALKLMNIAPGIFECESAFLCPFPGTDIEKHPDKYGIKILDNRWLKSLTLGTISCETIELDTPKLINMRNKFILDTRNEMQKIAAKLPFEIMDFHKSLADFGFHSLYYTSIIRSNPILTNYYAIRKCGEYKRISEIPERQLKYYRPYLINNLKTYERSANGYIIKSPFGDLHIKNEKEINIYDHSSGTISIEQIAQELSKSIMKNKSESEIISNVIIPFYRKLEKNYLLLLFR